MSGSLTTGSQHVALDLGMLRNGDESGTLSVGATHLTLVIVGGQAYEYVSKDFFKTIQQASHVPASACATICGKYISVSASPFSSFNLPGMTHQIESKMPVVTSVSHISSTTYEGQPAYELSGEGVRLYLAKNGTHYLLGMVAPTKFGTLNFSQWNAVSPISAPPASKIVNIG